MEDSVVIIGPLGAKYGLPFSRCQSWDVSLSQKRCAERWSNEYKATKPLIKSYVADEKLARRIDQGKFDLIGPTGVKILPQIWPHSILPGSEVHLRILEEDDNVAEGGTVSEQFYTWVVII